MSVTSLKELPPAVQDVLRTRTRDIVDRDQPFDVSDVARYGHFNRFAFAWNAGNRWVIVTERGGIAYRNPIYAISFDSTRKPSANVLAVNQTYTQSVCAEAKRLLTSE